MPNEASLKLSQDSEGTTSKKSSAKRKEEKHVRWRAGKSAESSKTNGTTEEEQALPEWNKRQGDWLYGDEDYGQTETAVENTTPGDEEQQNGKRTMYSRIS